MAAAMHQRFFFLSSDEPGWRIGLPCRLARLSLRLLRHLHPRVFSHQLWETGLAFKIKKVKFQRPRMTQFHSWYIFIFQFFYMLDNSSWLEPLMSKYPALSFAGWVCGKVYHLFFLPHCFLPFPLLKSKRYIAVMLNTYCGVFLFFGSWYLWSPLAKMILKPKSKTKKEE